MFANSLLNQVHLSFEVVEALRELSTISNNVEVSMSVSNNNIKMRLYAGQDRIEHTLSLEQLTQQHTIAITLDDVFQKLVHALKDNYYEGSKTTSPV